MGISRRTILATGAAAVGTVALGSVPLLLKSDRANAAGLGNAATGTLNVGIALGSGYQYYFNSLSKSEQQAEITRMKAANIGWVRMDAAWNVVQPTQNGAFNWEVPDTTARVMLTAGMKLDILLDESPAWARSFPNSLGSPWPAVDIDGYAAFCAAAATHYSAMGVDTFELWNEPNLDPGYAPAPKLGSPAGWGYLSPLGFADLAVAAYQAIKTAAPHATVLGGTLATHYESGNGGNVRTVSWGAIAGSAAGAGAPSPSAALADLHMLVGDFHGRLPVGTYVSAVSPGVGYTIAHPAWESGFPAIAGASETPVHLGYGYAPDVFLAQAYARAAKKPMWDALAIHPYTPPWTPAQQPAAAGGFTLIPALWDIMKANGDGAKSIWITEFGGATGRCAATWPATSAAATSLAVTSPQATTDDVHYELVAAGLPAGTFVWTATLGGGWTVLPPTGLVLASPLAGGTASTVFTVAATAKPMTIPAGTLVKVTMAPGDTSGVTDVVKTTTTQAVTTSTSAETAIPVNSVIPTAGYPAGSVIQASIGQEFGAAIPAAANEIVGIYPPGVAQNASVSEATQAEIITQTFAAIRTGNPLDTYTGGAYSWSYVAAAFVYCWSDAGGQPGPFGMVRADGTPKLALQALRTAAA